MLIGCDKQPPTIDMLRDQDLIIEPDARLDLGFDAKLLDRGVDHGLDARLPDVRLPDAKPVDARLPDWRPDRGLDARLPDVGFDLGTPDLGPDTRLDLGPDMRLCVPTERCNRIDDDCDGNIDEGTDLVVPPLQLEGVAQRIAVAIEGRRVGVLVQGPNEVRFIGILPQQPHQRWPIEAQPDSPLKLIGEDDADEFVSIWSELARDRNRQTVIIHRISDGIGPSLHPANFGSGQPDVIDAGRGLFAMVWIANPPAPPGPWMQFLNDNLAVIGMPTQVGDGGQAIRPRIGKNRDEYGVVWLDPIAQTVLFAQLNGVGGKEGPTITLSADPTLAESAPHVIGFNDNFGVTWHDARGIQIAIIERGRAQPPQRLHGGRWPTVAYDGQALAVAWSDPEILISRLTPDYQLLDEPISFGPSQSAPSLFGLNNEFLLGWINNGQANVLRRTFCSAP